MGGGSGKRRGRGPLRGTCLSCLYCALGRSQQPVRGAPGTSRTKVPFPGYCARGAPGRLGVSVQHQVADSSPRQPLALRTHATRGPGRSWRRIEGTWREAPRRRRSLEGWWSRGAGLGVLRTSVQSENISTNRILQLAEPVLTMTLTISRCHLSPLYRQETEGQPWKPTQVSEGKEETEELLLPPSQHAASQVSCWGSGSQCRQRWAWNAGSELQGGTPLSQGGSGPAALSGAWGACGSLCPWLS